MRIFQSQWKRRIDRVAVGAGWVVAANRGRGSVEVWNVASGQLVLSRPRSTRWGQAQVDAAELDGSGRLYLSLGQGPLEVLDPATQSRLAGPRPELGFAEVAVAANGARVLVTSSMSQGGAVSGWEAQADGTFRRLWKDGPREFHWFANPVLSADGRLAVTRDCWPPAGGGEWSNFALVIRDGARGKVVREVTPDRDGQPLRLALTADGRLLAGWVGVVRIWDVATGSQCGEIRNPIEKSFTGLAVHPGGEIIATTDAQGTILFWDARTLRETSALDWQLGGLLRSLAFAPDGSVAAAGTDDGRVVVWDVDG